MSSMGGGSTTDHMMTLLSVIQDPAAYKAKIEELSAAEAAAKQALAEQEAANKDAAEQLAQAQKLKDEAAGLAEQVRADRKAMETVLAEGERNLRKELDALESEMEQFHAERTSWEHERAGRQKAIEERENKVAADKVELADGLARATALEDEYKTKLARIKELAQ